MTPTLHKRAAAGTWHELDLVEQLGNVGSDFFGFGHAARMLHYRRLAGGP